MYVDYTIVQWTVQVSRIAYEMSTYVGYGIYVVFIIILLIYSLHTLNIINSQKQFTVGYRSQMGYLFINDMKYYLNYLDFLYDEERAERQYGKISKNE